MNQHDQGWYAPLLSESKRSYSGGYSLGYKGKSKITNYYSHQQLSEQSTSNKVSKIVGGDEKRL